MKREHLILCFVLLGLEGKLDCEKRKFLRKSMSNIVSYGYLKGEAFENPLWWSMVSEYFTHG